MKKGEIITAGLFILVALIGIMDASRLGFGWEADGPQAGFSVFWLALLLLVCAVLLVVINLKKTDPGDRFFENKEGLAEVVRIFFTAILLAIGIVYTGVYFATIGYCLLFVRWLGKHRWATVIIFTIIMTGAVYFGMEKGLKLPLPKSLLWRKGLFPI